VIVKGEGRKLTSEEEPFVPVIPTLPDASEKGNSDGKNDKG
jgi:hypothetical protein